VTVVWGNTRNGYTGDQRGLLQTNGIETGVEESGYFSGGKGGAFGKDQRV